LDVASWRRTLPLLADRANHVWSGTRIDRNPAARLAAAQAHTHA
jgi:hypothetical protein